ncbi:MAG: type II secretion system F family protein [Planctomycetes bacterium]|nr:type II secretion system F family protein [Planctomycetota bacterium]
MSFDYRARDNMGKNHHGTIAAEDREQATAMLARDERHVVELCESDNDSALSLFSRRVKKSDIVYVANQLAVMVDTGISLSGALQGIYEQTDNPRLRSMLIDLRNRVEGGEDLSVALGRYPACFDRTFVSLIKASERTGTLGAMLERVANHLRGQLDTQSRVRAAMAYPLIMVVLAVGTTVFLLAYILPKFLPLFKTKGLRLPRPTMIMMALSDALTSYWPAWLAALMMLVATCYFGRRTLTGRKFLDGLWIHLPILGPAYRKVVISRCISTLGAMLHAGVSLLESIELCAEIANNYHFEQAWLQVRDQVIQGNRVAESLRASKLFPRTLVQMINAGEETAKLDLVLNKVAQYYDREVETSLKAATSVIEPIMISVMGLIVGAIGLGIMLPIFSLSRAAGH